MLALLFMLAPAVLAQDGTPEPPQPSAERPLIFIRSSWVEPAVLAPGQLGRLYLELHNVGEAGARNVVIGIAGANFVPELSSSVKTVGSLQPNEHATVWQEMRVVPNIESGAYPVTVAISYRDEDRIYLRQHRNGGDQGSGANTHSQASARQAANRHRVVHGRASAGVRRHVHPDADPAQLRYRVSTQRGADPRRAQQLRRARHRQRDTSGEHRLAANGRRGDAADCRSGGQGRRQSAPSHPGLRQRCGGTCAERTEHRHPGRAGRGWRRRRRSRLWSSNPMPPSRSH